MKEKQSDALSKRKNNKKKIRQTPEKNKEKRITP